VRGERNVCLPPLTSFRKAITAMKKITRWIAVACLFMGSMAASAQGSKSYNPYSRANTQSGSESFGTLYVEYNPHSWRTSGHSTSFHGVSLGYSYFLPVVGNLGIDAGVKAQYFFRNEKKSGTRFKDDLFSASVPVNLAYDLRIIDSFGLMPFAGVYGRYNFSAKTSWEVDGESGRTSVSLFNKQQAAYYGMNTLSRFQFGWQAGVSVRLNEFVRVGAAYWMDFNEINEDTKLRGFNITLGATF